jgi:hypothetical protein
MVVNASGQGIQKHSPKTSGITANHFEQLRKMIKAENNRESRLSQINYH